MSIVLDDHHKLVKAVERLQKRHDQAVGAREQVIRQIREQYGCKTLKDAEALLQEKIQQRQEAFHEATQAREALEKEFPGILEEDS